MDLRHGRWTKETDKAVNVFHNRCLRKILDRRVTPSVKYAGTHLYTWTERGYVRIKYLAQEHNAVSPARARTWTAQSGHERTNQEARPLPAPPLCSNFMKIRWLDNVLEMDQNRIEKVAPRCTPPGKRKPNLPKPASHQPLITELSELGFT